MGLSDSLFTGLTGLNVNQTWLQVIGNNIANVNTTAFKGSRTLFTPQFYVTDQAGSVPATNFGGSNPSQRGLGATVDATQKDFTAGAIQTTGQATDMAIQGDGFFIVKGQSQLYTRDGAFTLNSNHQLVTTGGDFVQGYTADSNGTVATGSLQDVTIPLGVTTTAKPTQNVTLQGNLDAAGAVASGASILTTQDLTVLGGAAAPTAATALTQLASAASANAPLFTTGETFTLAGEKGGRTLSGSTFTVQAGSTVQDLLTFYQQGLGIDTTVPANPAVPAPGGSLEAGTAPNSAKIVVTGNTGGQNALLLPSSAFTGPGGVAPLTFADGSAGGFTSNPAGESVHTAFQTYDSLGDAVNVDVTAVMESQTTAGTTWRFYVNSPDNKAGGLPVGNGTLTFDAAGKLVASSGTNVTIDRSGTGSTTPLSFNLDFSSMTQFASATSSLQMTNQDGSAIGTLTSFSVGQDGTITGGFTNGLTRTLGRLAVATFANTQGLEDKGGNLFAAGANSGAAVVATPGQFGTGQILSGALEQSNVDISKEFTNLIVASTGYSASSRVITTSNQLIQELLNTGH